MEYGHTYRFLGVEIAVSVDLGAGPARRGSCRALFPAPLDLADSSPVAPAQLDGRPPSRGCSFRLYIVEWAVGLTKAVTRAYGSGLASHP